MMLIPYELKRRKGVRGIRITVHPGGRVVVTAPKSYPRFVVERLVRGREEWLREKRDHLIDRPVPLLHRRDNEEYRTQREEARTFVASRVAHFAPLLCVSPKRIVIRDQRTRWGSCSRAGTLSFSYKMLHLPEGLADYIVVHELCHLLVFDHSPRFWREVARLVPDYQAARQKLRMM